MNSSEVFGVIQQVAATTKSKEKQSIIQSHAGDDLFKKVIYYALNPQFVYGIIPNSSWGVKGDLYESRQDDFSDKTFQILDDLVARNLTGHAARDAIVEHLYSLNDASVELFIRIIRKDFRAGFSESTANKIWKGLIPKYPYMRCSLPVDSKITDEDYAKGVFSEIKYDGMFNNANCIVFTTQCTTRQGTNIPMEKFPEIAADLAHIDGYQTHGEFTIEQDGETLPRQIGNGIITSMIKGDGQLEANQKVVYTVWDIIPIDCAVPKGEYKVPYWKRVELLESLLSDKENVRIAEYKILYSKEECVEHAKEAIKRGLEGTIVKKRDMFWKDGTSKEQIKLKVEFIVDLEITGIAEGKKDTKVEGRPAALQCKTSCGEVLVNVTIKNEKMRDIIEADPDDWIGKVVSVVSNDIMLPTERKATHSLFLPRLAEDVYRIDKDKADDLSQVFKQYENAIKL